MHYDVETIKKGFPVQPIPENLDSVNEIFLTKPFMLVSTTAWYSIC